MPDPAFATDLFRRLEPNARILFVRLRSMGDCLLLTSPLRALRKEFPEFKVTVLVERRFGACFKGNPDVDQVMTTDSGKLATMRVLFHRHFDAIVNLHGGPTSLAYSLAARGVHVGLETYQYRRLYTLLVPHDGHREHTVEATLKLFQHLGVRAETPPPLFYAQQPREAEWVRESVGQEPYALIHPAALMSTKRWSPEGFAAIGRRLSKEGLRPVLTAGPGEENIVAATSNHLPGSRILLGLTIPRLAELIRGARIYVGNDAGPMHLAAAVGTPVVAVWGSSDSVRWRPWHVEHRVVQNPFLCNPCPGYRCEVARTPQCVESVTVEQVWYATQSLIDGK